MAHQKWKLLQVTWLPRDTATWTGWSQMESTGGEGQKCEGLSFDSNVPPDPEAVGGRGRLCVFRSGLAFGGVRVRCLCVRCVLCLVCLPLRVRPRVCPVLVLRF